MRRKLALWILALSGVNPGCNLAVNATRNLTNEAARAADNLITCIRNRKVADLVWHDIELSNPGPEYSEDYVRGFKDGFADYLDAGGTGLPPALPPRRYWAARYQTPLGHQVIADWSAGFWHGAAVAQETGYRQWVTIPSSLLPPNGLPPHPYPSATGLPPEPIAPSVLPAPRRNMPPADNDEEPKERPARPVQILFSPLGREPQPKFAGSPSQPTGASASPFAEDGDSAERPLRPAESPYSPRGRQPRPTSTRFPWQLTSPFAEDRMERSDAQDP